MSVIESRGRKRDVAAGGLGPAERASAGVNGGSPSATGTQSTPSFGAPLAFGVPVSGRPLVSSRFGLVGTSSTLTDWPQAWASNLSNGGVLWTFSGDWTLDGWLW